MSKILCVADIHIGDYPNRNPSNRYRLYQGSRTVAQNIIQVGKQEGCDYIVFAGDIIEKSMIRPYIQSEVKIFLDTVMNEFKDGFILYGNHDLDVKSNSQLEEDCCLSVMLPSNLHYVHQKSIQIDNTSIAFSNWQPKEIDLTWLDHKVDVLFTHATICYEPTGVYESEKLDETKFDLAICGDIHKPATIGKYVSIGIPQRCKMTDNDQYNTGVVYDCISKSWNWVNLNPNDNLMKFEYTQVLEDEGWNEKNHTWYIYKQDLFNNSLDPKIKVSAWEEINELIEDSICKANLQKIHTEVIKNIENIDASEVDFNYTLQRFHCENWRSITDLTLDFNKGDKIFLQGKNGSGKSSIISAIKYAFCDTGDTVGLSSLKSFIQFGKKNCMTEVEFLFQGNKYKIRRGTAEYGLWINDEPQKYSEKKLFEKDVRDRFKFINYMNSFFLDANNNQFIGNLSSEELTEIISRFYKLDKIDTYCDTAKFLSDKIRRDEATLSGKVKETEKLLDYIKEKLNSIILPSLNKAELVQMRNEGLELQRKNNLWNNFVNTTARLQVEIQEYTNNIQELNKQKSNFRSIDLINSEINNLKSNQGDLQTQLINLSNIKTNLDYKNRELIRLKNEGNNLWLEAQNLSNRGICPKCGQKIQNTEALEHHRLELLNKVEEIRPQVENLNQEIQTLTTQWNNSEREYNRINQEINAINVEISKRLSEITSQNQLNKDLGNKENLLKQAQIKLSSLGYVEEVILPDNFMEKMSEINRYLTIWDIYESSIKDEEQKKNELDSYNKELTNIHNALGDFDSYIKLTGPTGIIYENIFNKLKNKFSDNLVNYEVVKKKFRNKDYLTITPQFIKGPNQLIDYSAASSGERTLLDIHFMSRIISRTGLIVLDEFLKYLDTDRLEICLDILKDLDIGCMFLSSHVDNIGNFYNKVCKVSLNDKDLTEVDLC